MKFNKNINLKLKNVILISALLMMSLSFTNIALADSDLAHLEITLLNQDPDPAEQGEYLDLRWKVIKSGNAEIDDISFTLETEYPFSFDGTDTPIKKIGSWRGNSFDDEYYILHYKIKVDESALEDTYDIKLKVNYDGGKEYYSRDFEINVGDKIEPDFVLGTLVTSPIKLLADTEENELKVTLENIGDDNAETVRMELELPQGFSETYGYSSRANLGTIDAGSSSVGTFYIDLDETVIEGEQDGLIKIYYKESNDEDNKYKTIELPIKIPVNGKPMFSIEEIKTNPDIIKVGNEVELLLTIKNYGSKEAESVSIRAFKESSQPFEFDEKSDFIGKLKPGESGEAVLKLNIDSKANLKTYLLDIEVRGLYNDDVIIENEVIPITIKRNNGETIKTTIGIIIVAILVIIGGGYYVIKKKK